MIKASILFSYWYSDNSTDESFGPRIRRADNAGNSSAKSVVPPWNTHYVRSILTRVLLSGRPSLYSDRASRWSNLFSALTWGGKVEEGRDGGWGEWHQWRGLCVCVCVCARARACMLTAFVVTFIVSAQRPANPTSGFWLQPDQVSHSLSHRFSVIPDERRSWHWLGDMTLTSLYSLAYWVYIPQPPYSERNKSISSTKAVASTGNSSGPSSTEFGVIRKNGAVIFTSFCFGVCACGRARRVCVCV